MEKFLTFKIDGDNCPHKDGYYCRLFEESLYDTGDGAERTSQCLGG